jgi:hypothetical protein
MILRIGIQNSNLLIYSRRSKAVENPFNPFNPVEKIIRHP